MPLFDYLLLQAISAGKLELVEKPTHWALVVRGFGGLVTHIAEIDKADLKAMAAAA